MTRKCDNCGNIIPLGKNHIYVNFIGMKKMAALFKCNQLDFCSLNCLVIYWSNKEILEGNK